MHQAVQSGDVKVRIYAMVCALNNSENFVDKIILSGVTTGLGDERFKIGPAKVFTDGRAPARRRNAATVHEQPRRLRSAVLQPGEIERRAWPRP